MGSFKKFLHYNFQYLGHPHWDRGVSPRELNQYIEDHSLGNSLHLDRFQKAYDLILDTGCYHDISTFEKHFTAGI